MTDNALIQQYNDAAARLIKEGQFPAAITMLKRAVAAAPNFATGWSNLGSAHWHAGDYAAAEVPMIRALGLEPDMPAHNSNFGFFCMSTGRHKEGMAYMHRALELAEKNQVAGEVDAKKWELGLAYLKAGDWENGFHYYESRIPHNGAPKYRKFPCPTWDGSSLDDKVIFVAPEQGIGDRILSSRLLCEIKRRWPTCHIITSGDAAWQNLLWEFQVEGICDVVPWGAPILTEGLDFAIYTMSLLDRLGIRPDNVPADPGLIRRRAQKGRSAVVLPELPGDFKIGIAWTGSPVQIDNNKRTIPVEKLLTIGEDPRVSLFSFQVGAGAEQLRDCGGQMLCYPLGEEIAQEGLVAGAAALMEMDLVVSVCTLTAHLAAACGVQTWVMLNADPWWLWLQQSRRDLRTSPLWPTVRLYRQPQPGDWDSVIEDVRSDLRFLIKDRAA